MIQKNIIQSIQKALIALDIEHSDITLEYPADINHGEFSSNVAMILSKKLGRNPKELAQEIANKIEKTEEISRIEVAGPGFINFHLSPIFYASHIQNILKTTSTPKTGKKVIVEYTQPNPFKVIHIGHMMNNAIGECIARLAAYNGNEVKRANYQGDVGLHVAKAVYGMKMLASEMPVGTEGNAVISTFLGKAYAVGSKTYEENEEAKKEIVEINKKVYTRSDEEINKLYDTGRKWSLDSFEVIYKRLGTSFDYYFFESITGPIGKKLVESHIDDGVFEKSDGAIIFPGEKHGLHTRVFITKEGLPTYEAKELGLMELKYQTYPFDTAVYITANEIEEYFKVLVKAGEFVHPEVAGKIKHVPHGMLKLPTGKMSSRTGDIVAAETLIDAVTEKVKEKMADKADAVIAEQIAIAAIKYTMLKPTVGKDIIFDMDKSLSFEGDSGPYLQYSAVRAQSVLKKAQEQNIQGSVEKIPEKNTKLEVLISRFDDVVARAWNECAPSDLVTYLTDLCGAFNHFYAENKIAENTPEARYNIVLTEAFLKVMKTGLGLMAVQVPERM